MSIAKTTPFNYSQTYFGHLPPEINSMIFDVILQNGEIANETGEMGLIYTQAKQRLYLSKGMQFPEFRAYLNKCKNVVPLSEKCAHLDTWKEGKWALGTSTSPKGEIRWIQPLHHYLNEVLSTLNQRSKFEEAFSQFKSFLDLHVNVNATTSNRHTALTILCKSVNEIDNPTSLVKTQLTKLLRLLLEKGADPNQLGNPSSPLLSLLHTHPRTGEQQEFKMKILVLLLEGGADPHKQVEQDYAGYTTTPYVYSTENYRAASFYMPEPETKTSINHVPCAAKKLWGFVTSKLLG